KVHQVNGPTRLALTELTLTSDTGLNTAGAGIGSRIEVVALTRTSGTAPCSYGASGWTQKSVRWLDSQAPGTTQITFPTPLVLPAAAAGQPLCIGFEYWLRPSNAVIWVGISGYK